MTRALRILILLMFCLTPALAAGEDGSFCPVYMGGYKASLASDRYQERAGKPIQIKVKLDPAKPPKGYAAVVKANFLQAPRGKSPEIKGEFPSLSITCREAGDYVVKVVVDMMTTPDCGGKKVETLLDRTVTLSIKP